MRVFFLLLLALASSAFAQSWPAKPPRVIIPFAPGGPTDIAARLISVKLQDSLGQPMVVESRAGASGNIGTAAVAKSAADGYTLLLTSSSFAVNASLFPNAGYDAEKDFIPVALIAWQPNMVFVNAGMPVRTLAELLAQAKSGKLAYAAPGSGTTPHLTAENLFRVLAKVDITPVQFRGAGLMVTAVVGGEPPVGVGAISGPIGHIKGGRLRGLAVSSEKRVPALPDVPTLAESGFPGLHDYTWIAVFAPTGTPAPIVQKLNEAINSALQQPDVRERLDAVAFDPLGGSQPQVAAYVKAEIAKWAKVVRDTGVKPD